jgi:hypothetical protein
MSCGLGSSTKSISPESSAARRVASALIGWYTISVTLPSRLPHQLELSTATVFTSASRLRRMKGPVPFALRVAKVSSLFL